MGHPKGVPEAHREAVAAGLATAFGDVVVADLRPVRGGASGALTYRVETGHGPHLVRVETMQGPMRNPHQYSCMQIAADAGVAPPLRYASDADGVLIIPFIEAVSVTTYPGGLESLAAAEARLLARLHATAPFPAHRDHLAGLAAMLGHLTTLGRVGPGLLDLHREAFERLRAAYPWQPDTFVSAHNDPNQFNILFDGDRLWLIDWETASRNDPFVDLATLCAHVAPTPELRAGVLRTWLDAEPDEAHHARLTLMDLVVKLFAGCVLLLITDEPATHADLHALSTEEFTAQIVDGTLVRGEPATAVAFAKLMLRVFLVGMTQPDTEQALATLR